MNLSKLFVIQAKLDERIVQEHKLQGQDLLDEKILSLQVELGECANEWRGFKFWSKDQEPRVAEKFNDWDVDALIKNGIDVKKKNPLLEEYVDCLHFILSIGLEMNLSDVELVGLHKNTNVTHSFLILFDGISKLEIKQVQMIYNGLFERFIELGNNLGFTWSEIEQAYMDKNKINHERQANGY